jgi:hypothetical protein
MEPATHPRYTITLEGQKYTLQFDTEDSPTKRGINMQIVLPEGEMDPRKVQELASKITVALQKKLANSNIAVDYNERNPYKNVISYIIPLNSISKLIINSLKS